MSEKVPITFPVHFQPMVRNDHEERVKCEVLDLKKYRIARLGRRAAIKTSLWMACLDVIQYFCLWFY